MFSVYDREQSSDICIESICLYLWNRRVIILGIKEGGYEQSTMRDMIEGVIMSPLLCMLILDNEIQNRILRMKEIR